MSNRDKTRNKQNEEIDATGGELSLSIEETNKLRISLGLKPLTETTESTPTEKKSRLDEKQKEDEREKLKEKLRKVKEKRQEEQFFSSTKPLGEADDSSGDDVAAWVQKSRIQEMDSKSKIQQKPQDPSPSTPSSDADEKSEEEGVIAPELEGKKVKHKPSDIKIGETLVLTLEDQPILNEKGELNMAEDALENTLIAQESRRQKAYRASKPKRDDGFDAYGQKKDLLSKYDEEEEEAMTLDPFNDHRQNKESGEMKESLQMTFQSISDYIGGEMEEEEHRPTKRRKKKLRKKSESDVLDIVAELEAQKDEQMDWEENHESRADRRARLKQKEEDSKLAKEKQNKKFDKALEKANLEALKLKFQAEDIENEKEMSDALARAQLMAKQTKRSRFEELAAETKAKKEEQKPLKTEQKHLVFTDTSEFCRLIAGEAQELNKQPIITEEDTTMTDEMETTNEKPERRRHLRSKSTTSAQEDKSGSTTEKAEDTVLREPVLGTGLAAALSTLREKGDLKQKFEWVGRTNDMKKSKLIGVDDFYTCGEVDSYYDNNIETALTRKDAFGRVLTPKEAFRAISYAFHGKGPSQKTLEKRKRKMNDDFLANRSNLDQESQLTRLKAVQKVQKNPFVMLTGTGQLGKEIREEKKKTTKKAKAEARSEFPSLTSVLDRNGSKDTFLEPKKKVDNSLEMDNKE